MKVNLKERRKKKAVCPKCKSPDYKKVSDINEEEGKTKPTFECNSCGNTWQFGRDGGIYSQLL